MADIAIESPLEQRCNEIISEFVEFKERMSKKVDLLKESKLAILKEIENERAKLKADKAQTTKEKDAWEKEKERIAQIQPLEDILKLNISGKDDLSVRRSTLCHVQGSALEAMFSGRHTLQKLDGKIFVDRNPLAFNLMVDFIRNSGQLNEQQQNNNQMLKLELKFWGIDEDLFKERPKDKFEIIQDVLDRPYSEFFGQQEGSQFFYDKIESGKLNFRELYNQGKLKFKNEFRIRWIQEIVGVEYGPNFDQMTQFGRIWAKDYFKNDQFAYDGEIILDDDKKPALDGFGRFIGYQKYQQGKWKTHKLHGQAKMIFNDGTILKGHFLNDQLNGKGKVILPDSTIEEGNFQNDELNGPGKRILRDGTIQEGNFRDGQLIP